MNATEAAAIVKNVVSMPSEARSGFDTQPWPEPEPLPDSLPPVQGFSKDLLPESLLPLVEDVAERMQVPIDYPAVVQVLCIAGAVNRRVTMQPKGSDTSWVVVPNLWGGIVAPPGYLKSPVIQAMTRPLNQIQTEWRLQHEEGLKNYAYEKEEYDLRHAAWREQYKSAAKKGGGLKRSTQHPSRRENVTRKPKKVKGKRRGRLALVCKS